MLSYSVTAIQKLLFFSERCVYNVFLTRNKLSFIVSGKIFPRTIFSVSSTISYHLETKVPLIKGSLNFDVRTNFFVYPYLGQLTDTRFV